jgi:hypothetical protein
MSWQTLAGLFCRQAGCANFATNLRNKLINKNSRSKPTVTLFGQIKLNPIT